LAALSAHTIAKGLGVSGGIYTGPVTVILSVDQLLGVKEGDVVVVKSSNPAWTVAMLKCGAIVAEIGGQLAHAAILAREIGIPSVVSVAGATALLEPGSYVTVNGTAGTVTVAEKGPPGGEVAT